MMNKHSSKRRLGSESAKLDKDNKDSKCNPAKKLKEIAKEDAKSPAIDDFLSSLNIYILNAGIEKARSDIFTKQVKRFGGSIVDFCDDDVNLSHIVVDEKMNVDRFMRLLNLNHFPKTVVVKSTWLSLCLKHKRLVDLEEYVLKPPDPDEREFDDDSKFKESDRTSTLHRGKLVPEYSQNNEVQHLETSNINVMLTNERKLSPKPYLNNSGSDYEPSEDEDNERLKISSQSSPTTSSNLFDNRKQFNVNSWICAQSSKNPKPNMNSHITNKLEEMVKAYASTNDKWRAFGYQKAIQALRRHPKEISTWEEAKALPGVGGRLADKIWEIAQSGELRKLTEFKSSEEVNILQMFNDVWGAGPHTAQLWYQQGFRSIKDLQEKANLNHQQKVGVRLYDDLIERMPREEAGKIEKLVREAAESLSPGVVAQACGSYRRGKVTCGDVDVLVTHPDGRSHKGLFGKLLSKLKENGFLTDDLVTAEEGGDQKKYLGVCKLPGEKSKHRRLDIIVVPYEEYGCALVYFTGSAHFNRSLRHMCKKQNMSLNEHALKIGVVRKGTDKIYEGTVVPTPTEEDVFKALKVPYRPPEERDH